MKRVRLVALSFFICTLAWGATPSVSHAAATSTVITQSTTFSPGEYFFDSLTITGTSTLTLLGNPTATTSFKGVIIHTENLIVDSGSRISADSKGYGANQGPGASSLSGAGASYGGVGASNTATSAPTYGSAMEPVELGSGGNSPGGGAMQLLVSGSFINDGTISANGGSSGSGGSILVTAGTLSGKGSFKALGGNLWASGYYKQSGGGGRIMIRYASSAFTGTVDVSGGCGGPNYARICAENGTAGFIDTTTNMLLLPQAWRFQTNDSPFSFASIVVAKGSVSSDPGVSITADQLALSAQGSVSFGNGVHLRVPLISLGGASILSFSGAADAVVDDLTVAGGSKVTTALGQALDLSLANLTVSSGSSVDVSAKGYTAMKGLGAPSGSSSGMGASYGGKGYANTATSTYGDARNPTDLGSGGYGAGGGALALTLSGTLANNGSIVANGQWSGSGGSILVHAHEIIGGGTFSANGAGKDSASFLGPAGGGRIALYTDTTTSSFTGTVEAKGACNTNYGYYVYCGGDGTVVIGSNGPTVSNVLFLPGIQASRLYMKENGKERLLWEPNTNSDISLLAMTDAGASINTVYTRDIIDEVWGWHTDVYGGFSQFMDGLVASSTVGLKEWRPYPYDWRQDVFDVIDDGSLKEDGSREYLLDVAAQMASSSPTKKITVVAHSNGGLLAKALMVRLREDGKEDLVEKMILVASPHIGTPKAVFSLLHGYDQDYGLGFVGNAATVRAASRNFAGVYGLLPSAAYFARVQSPLANFNTDSTVAAYRKAFGATLDSYAELTKFMLNSPATRSTPKSDDIATPLPLNKKFVDKAAATHALLDAWQPPAGVTVNEIVGWGNETVSMSNYKDATTVNCIKGSVVCKTKEYMGYQTVNVIDGDKTVVSASAAYLNNATYFNLAELNRGFFTKNYDHGLLLSSSVLDSYLQGLLTGSQNSQTLQYFSSTTPTGIGRRLVLVGAHSPVLISATDSAGRVTGIFPSPNAGSDLYITKEEIPDSSVSVFGEEKYLALPEDTAVNIRLVGTGSGAVTLDTTDADGTVLSSYENIPVVAGSVIETNIQNDALGTLTLDLDGDGAVDIQTSGTPSVADSLKLLKERIAGMSSLVVRNRLAALHRSAERYAKDIRRAGSILTDMEKLVRSQSGRTIPKSDADAILILIQSLKNRR